MKKSLLLFCCTLLFASSVFSANLNVYASGLKVTGITEDRKLSISYFLNAPADVVIFQLLDASNPSAAPIYEVALDGKAKGENTVTLDLLDKIDTNLSGNFTWAIKATSNTANESSVLVGGGTNADARFQFYTPAGLAVDNNSNSPYFGQIYVSESRQNQPIRVDKANKQSVEGIYIFKPDLSGGETAYAGNVEWNEDDNETSLGIPDALYAPARITIDEEGYVYICDNSPSSYEKSGVWRMNPADPSADFVDVLDSESNYGKNGKTATGLYRRINSAVVVGSGSNKKLIAIDNLGTGTEGSTHLVEFPLNEDGVSDKTKTVLVDLHNGGKGVVNAFNTLVKGIYEDYWIFQFRNTKDVTDVTGIMHINNQHQIAGNIGLEYCRRGAGAISPDGKWLAYNDDSGIAIYEINNYEANTIPSLSLGNPILRIHKADTKIDGIAFDVAGNLYFASAYYERFYAYALEKKENTHTTVAPNSQKIVLNAISPRIRMMAYNLRLTVADDKYNFSFYANSKPLAGNLLIYSDKELTKKVLTVALSNLNQGTNNVSVDMSDLSHNDGKDLYWAVELTGEQNPVFGEVYRQDESLNRAYAVIDNNPESNFFGRIYVANRIEGTDDEMYVLDYDYSYLVKKKPIGTFSAARPAVDAEGFVYWADYGDTGSGIMIMDPSTFVTNQFFQGEKNNKGVWINNSVAVGSSTPGVYVYGAGSDTKLYMVNEDPLDTHAAYSYCVYNIGQGDGSILRTWGAAPSKTVAVTDNDGQNFSIVATTHGVFLCQNRELNMNKKDAYSLQFYNNNGERCYVSDGKALIINGSYGGGMAVSRDESQLAMVNGKGGILLFDIEWNGDTPGLTPNRTYETDFSAISTIHFDYAGNLVVTAGTGYGYNHLNDLRLVVYSQPTDNNTIIVPAPSSQRIPALILDEKKDNSTLLSAAAAQGKTTNTVRVLRSLTSGMYNTLCLPFALNSLEGTCLEGAKVYNYTGSEKQGEDLYLHFTETSSIVAGVPYLVEPTMDIDVLDFTNVEISVTAVEIAGTKDANGVAFNGILAPKELIANDKSVLFLISGNRLAWADERDYMYGFRGYFKVPGGASQIGARAFISTSESGMTALQQPTQQVEVTKFMHNGVLYIQRDGAIYTVMGTKVQ